MANNLSGPATPAANPPGNRVTVIDPATSKVLKTIDLGVSLQPFGVAFRRDGKKAYVTNWMGRSVSVIDTATEAKIEDVELSPPSDPLEADHPSAVAANPKRNEVYTANANSDTVSVIDANDDNLSKNIDVSLVPGGPKGASPDGLDVSPDGRTLYVAEAGENAVAVVDLRSRRTVGFIPTSWYPADVDVTPDGKQLVVTNTNNSGAGPNPCGELTPRTDCPAKDPERGDPGRDTTDPQYAGSMIKGSISVIGVPRTRAQLRSLTEEVKRNNPGRGSRGAQAALARRDQARDLRDQGEPHLRPRLRRPAARQRRPVAEPVQGRLGAEPPRARPPLHADRQLLRRRRGLGRRPQLDHAGERDRLRRQDLAGQLLAAPARRPALLRLRGRAARGAVRLGAARLRPERAALGRGADRRLPLGQRLRPRRVLPRLRRVHAVPGRLLATTRGAQERVEHDAPERRALRRPRRQPLPGLQHPLLRPRRPPARVGARVPRVREEGRAAAAAVW